MPPGRTLKLLKQCRFITLCLLAVVSLSLGATGCGAQGLGASGRSSSEGGKLTVFAAASLTEAVQEIAARFEADNRGVEVELNLAGSQELRLQLEHGARADAFLPADPRQMALAVEAGVVEGDPVIFATNRLVLLGAIDSQPGDVPEGAGLGESVAMPDGLAAFRELADPGVTVAIGLPQVPAGAYARQALAALEGMFGEEEGGYSGRVMANVVTMETNVRGVAMKVALGEVDRGFVYTTDAVTPFIARRTFQVGLPSQADPGVEYLATRVSGAAQPELAERFLDFLLSAAGQEILQSHGFGAPPAGNDRSGARAGFCGEQPTSSGGICWAF